VVFFTRACMHIDFLLFPSPCFFSSLVTIAVHLTLFLHLPFSTLIFFVSVYLRGYEAQMTTTIRPSSYFFPPYPQFSAVFVFFLLLFLQRRSSLYTYERGKSCRSALDERKTDLAMLGAWAGSWLIEDTPHHHHHRFFRMYV